MRVHSNLLPWHSRWVKQNARNCFVTEENASMSHQECALCIKLFKYNKNHKSKDKDKYKQQVHIQVKNKQQVHIEIQITLSRNKMLQWRHQECSGLRLRTIAMHPHCKNTIKYRHICFTQRECQGGRAENIVLLVVLLLILVIVVLLVVVLLLLKGSVKVVAREIFKFQCCTWCSTPPFYCGICISIVFVFL